MKQSVIEARLQTPGSRPLGGLGGPSGMQPTPSTTVGHIFDPRSSAGMFARGKNVYEAGATLGPPGAGRPRENAATFSQGGVITPQLMQAIQGRLRGYTDRAADKSRQRWAN
jgi:hypothetical protein